MSRGAVPAAACALVLAGCTYAMGDLRFRTREPDDAFGRAVRAVEHHCWGVKIANEENQLVYSHWQAWPTSDGVYLARCLVSIVPVPEDRSSEVRVSMAMKQCPLADLLDPDALAETCTFTTVVPAIVADQLVAAGQQLEAAVRR